MWFSLGGYAAGGQSYGGKRRAEESPRGGDWKRARGKINALNI